MGVWARSGVGGEAGLGRAVGGLGMLLHQAAPGFRRWFGAEPTVTPELRATVEAEIAAADAGR